jgi:hypothetical protein
MRRAKATGRRRALVALCGLGLAVSACENVETRATGRQIASRTELVGGPSALGEVGDFLLENDKVRIVIQGPGFSRGFGVYGGSLIDADLQRPMEPGTPAGGRGKDLFGELFPVFFIQALVPDAVKVLSDGSDGGSARVSVTGTGGDFLTLTRTLNQVVTNSNAQPDGGILGLLDPRRPETEPNLAYEMVYELPPGARYVKLNASVKNITETAIEMPSPTVGPLLSTLLGATTPFQVPMGFISLFGAGNSVFVPGTGYGVRWALDDSYAVAAEKGLGFPALPGLITPGLVTTSSTGISYGLFALPDPKVPSFAKAQVNAETGANRYTETYGVEVGDDAMLIPFLASAFTAVFYGQAPAKLEPDESFGITNYFIIGDGDVASVMNTVYELRGLATEELAGEVRDALTAAPVAGASVVVYSGDAPVNQFYTDASGRFRGRMPKGSYSARILEHPMLSEKVPFDVGSGGQFLRLDAPTAAHLAVTVVDEDGRPLPAKVSVVGRYGKENAGKEARRFLFDTRVGEHWRHVDLTPDDPNDPETLRYLETHGFTGIEGRVSLTVPPGDWEVWVSRGPEYTVERRRITVGAGKPAQVAAQLRQVLDTKGWIACDFHVHADPSLDSSLPLEERVLGAAAGGLELLTSTDHNFITDYAPYIERLGLQDYMTSQVGLELTTLEAGHFNGFPLRYEVGKITKGAFEWSQQTPDELFAGIREHGLLGPENTIVQVNHPRDSLLGYFEQHNFNALSAEIDTLMPVDFGNLVAPSGSAFYTPEGESTFSLEFDAMELFNGGVVAQVRNATRPESIEGLDIPEDTLANLPETPGTVLCEEDGEVAYPGAVDDWFNLLNLGRRIVGTGNSDSHDSEDIGVPRTYLNLGVDAPRDVKLPDVVKAFRNHAALVTNGPFVLATVEGQSIGAEVKTTKSSVKLKVDVQVAPWLDAKRGRITANGYVVETFDVTIADGRFVKEFDLVVPKDTWFVVEVEGDTNLFPVAPPITIPPSQIDDALVSIGGPLGFGSSEYGDLEPGPLQRWTPYAITNPIWVNVGEAEWVAPGVRPRRCKGRGVEDVPAAQSATVEKRGLPRDEAAEKRRWAKQNLVPSRLGFPRVRHDLTDVRVIFDQFRHGH